MKAEEIPTWDIIHGLQQLTQPSNQIFQSLEARRYAPFAAQQGIDHAGKTFHAEAIAEVLARTEVPLQHVTVPKTHTVDVLLRSFSVSLLHSQFGLSICSFPSQMGVDELDTRIVVRQLGCHS